VKNSATKKALKALTTEFMELKLAPKLFDQMVAQLRDTVNQHPHQERQVMALCVRDAGMPRKDFIASFPKNETNLNWVDKHIRAKRKHSSQLGKLQGRHRRTQKRLQKLELLTSLTIARSRRSTARFRSARRRRAARRRRWSRRTCVS
jgi:RNA polymerase primary sigma factor